MTSQRDDNLENFFLNRINEYNIDFREEDWHRLNEMLDASDAVKAAALKQKIAWIGSGTMLVVSIALLLWMSRSLNGPGTQEKEISPSEGELVENKPQGNEEESIQPFVSKDQTVDDTRDVRNQDELLTIHPLNSEDEKEVISRESVEGESGKVIDIESDYNETSDVENEAPRKGEKQSIPDKLGEEPPGMDPSLIAEEGPEKDLFTLGKESQKWEQISEIDDQNTSADSPELPLGHPVGVAIVPAGSDEILIDRSEFNVVDKQLNPVSGLILRKNYAWNFSLAADNSAVGISDFDGPSLRMGLSLEYFITKRLSVMAGVNYSVKTYTAYGREYTPPYGFWTKGVIPDETLGECNVVDIPLNITYYFPNSKGQAFFIRSGLSSWLMLEEHYWYNYKSNDPDLIKYWGGENENYHYFSVLDLSVGFEHPLNRKFSILVEPYLNIPLGGVGFGKVDLYSAGLKTALRINHYKLSLKKQ